MKEEVIKVVRYVLVCALMCVFIACMVAILLRTPFLANQSTFLARLLLSTSFSGAVILIIGALALSKKPIWKTTFAEYFLCAAASVLLMALFFSLGPMTIDRSYTIFSLADMADHADESYTAEEIRNRFVNDYVDGAGESQKRLDEQLAIGNVLKENMRYRISEKGKRLVRFFRFVEAIFPVPDKNSIYPNGR